MLKSGYMRTLHTVLIEYMIVDVGFFVERAARGIGLGT